MSARAGVQELRAFMLASQRFRQAMADHFDLTLSEMVVLGHLADANQGLTPRDIGERMLLPSGTLTAVLDRLAGKGHARREPNPADRRSSLVRLTAAGRQTVRYVERRLDTVLAATEASIGPDSRAALAGLATALDQEANRLTRAGRSRTAR